MVNKFKITVGILMMSLFISYLLYFMAYQKIDQNKKYQSREYTVSPYFMQMPLVIKNCRNKNIF